MEVAETCQLALQRIEAGLSDEDLEAASPYKARGPVPTCDICMRALSM